MDLYDLLRGLVLSDADWEWLRREQFQAYGDDATTTAYRQGRWATLGERSN